MPRLSFKERQNIFEASQMDEDERKAWEDLGVHVTPAVQRRLEAASESGLDAFDPRDGIVNQDEINAKIRAQNKLVEEQAVCVKCGQWTSRANAETENGLTYCAYCHAVCFGSKDDNWPPRITRGESTRGLHRA
jgi:formylmethanofuran dehydrogenase subunit E